MLHLLPIFSLAQANPIPTPTATPTPIPDRDSTQAEPDFIEFSDRTGELSVYIYALAE